MNRLPLMENADFQYSKNSIFKNQFMNTEISDSNFITQSNSLNPMKSLSQTNIFSNNPYLSKTILNNSFNINTQKSSLLNKNQDLFNQTNIDKNLESFILSKIEERKLAKQNKDFVTADKIRNELIDKGVELIDTKNGTEFKII